MKISKLKQELARIISENGGWREGADTCSCDQDGYVNFFVGNPTRSGGSWLDNGNCEYIGGIITPKCERIKNWHQTILSREEYFHLYQAPDAKPTIEQLVAEYRNAKDCADSKQQEADEAKAVVEAKLKALELAGEDIGLLLSPITANKEPELVITDWRDLQAGDVISVSGKWWEPDSEYTVDENDGSRGAPIRVGDYWAFVGECSFKFIRRP